MAFIDRFTWKMLQQVGCVLPYTRVVAVLVTGEKVRGVLVVQGHRVSACGGWYSQPSVEHEGCGDNDSGVSMRPCMAADWWVHVLPKRCLASNISDKSLRSHNGTTCSRHQQQWQHSSTLGIDGYCRSSRAGDAPLSASQQKTASKCGRKINGRKHESAKKPTFCLRSPAGMGTFDRRLSSTCDMSMFFSLYSTNLVASKPAPPPQQNVKKNYSSNPVSKRCTKPTKQRNQTGTRAHGGEV